MVTVVVRWVLLVVMFANYRQLVLASLSRRTLIGLHFRHRCRFRLENLEFDVPPTIFLPLRCHYPSWRDSTIVGLCLSAICLFRRTMFTSPFR